MREYKYRQLAEVLLAQINGGVYPPQGRLPAIRSLATEHSVNTATVIGAYKYLEKLGHVYTRTGSGIYITPPKEAEEAAFAKNGSINFAGGDTDPALFPAVAFGQCVTDVLERDGKTAFIQSDNQGYAPLRKALAGEAGIDPARVILLTGLQQGRDIATRIKKRHARVAVEEDVDGDFYYEGVPPQHKWEDEPDGHVIYIKSYAKILMHGLAYMVAPSGLAGECAALAGTPAAGLVQRAFDLFLRLGGFAVHAANMRATYGKRYRKVLAAVRAYLSHYTDYTATGCGLFLPLRLKHMYPREMESLYQCLLQRKVIVSPLSGFGIGFAAVQEERIAEGIGIIAAALAKPGTEAR
jgi:DNA-binding transcriptional MocR family regulator